MSTNSNEPARLLSVESLHVSFGADDILHDVSLGVTAGEIVTLIGPNGSGKTTLVRTALGLVRARSGRVWRKPALRIGYVPQSITVDMTLPLSVQRFVTLGPQVRAVDAAKALAELEVTSLKDRPIRSLSGGEMRRVLLARALANRPELLVLDEPTAGVDVGGQADLYALIESLRTRHGCAVLLISHDLHLVMASTDRVVCLNRHVCCTGTPQDVVVHPEYLTLFGSQHKAQLALYTHHHDHSHDLHGDMQADQHDHKHQHRDPHADESSGRFNG